MHIYNRESAVSLYLSSMWHAMRSFTLLLLKGMAFVQIDNVERRSSQAAAQLLGELKCSL